MSGPYESIPNEGRPSFASPVLPELVADHETPPQHRASIIFLSYRFSQGGIGTQNRLLLHIENNYVRDLFADREIDEVKYLVHEMAGSYFLNPRLHPATAIPWEDDSPDTFVKTGQLVTNELAGLFERFRDRKSLSVFDSGLVPIAQSVIVMDADYLSRPGGRAGDSDSLKIKVSPYVRDPYASMFIGYGILKNSTNTREFDGIFHGLATEAVLRQLDQITLGQLLSNIALYESKHPEMANDMRISQVKTFCEGLIDG